MSELSPQAQAILDAYNAGFARPVAVHHKPRIAAVMRAVIATCAYNDFGDNWIISPGDLEDIATELEAQ